MLPIWLHSILLTLLSTIAPALAVIFVLAHEPASSVLCIKGANDPLPLLIFFGGPIATQAVFRLLIKERCVKCDEHATFRVDRSEG